MFPTMLGDLSTSPYTVLGDCADHRARLRSQPCSGTGRPVSMSCSGTVRPPSTITFPTVLHGSSITPCAVLGTYFGYSPTTAWRPLFSVTYELDWIILIFRPCYKAHTSPSSKLGDYIGTMHLVMHLSFLFSMKDFLFGPWHHVTTSPITRLGD